MNVSNHVPADSVITIGGTSYTVSVPRWKDLIELVNFVKQRTIDTAKADCAGLPVDVQKDIMRRARNLARKIEWATADFFQSLTSADAITYAFYLLIRKNHPDQTPESAGEIFGADPKAADAVATDSLLKAAGINPTTATAEAEPK